MKFRENQTLSDIEVGGIYRAYYRYRDNYKGFYNVKVVRKKDTDGYDCKVLTNHPFLQSSYRIFYKADFKTKLKEQK
jgi:hypothetical protein